ncbi:hypothetical protein BOVMAS35_07820 [Streptococcus uberis]
MGEPPKNDDKNWIKKKGRKGMHEVKWHTSKNIAPPRHLIDYAKETINNNAIKQC